MEDVNTNSDPTPINQVGTQPTNDASAIKFEQGLADYKRRKKPEDFLYNVRELFDRVAKWIDEGMQPEDALERLRADPGVHYATPVTDKGYAIVTYQAWLDRGKRAEQRQREEDREKERQTRLAEEAAKKEREEAEKKAEQERKEQAERDKLSRKELERRKRVADGQGTFADEAVEPLPGDLRLVTFQLDVEHEDDDTAESAIERVFGSLGCVNVAHNGDGYGIKVEIVTPKPLADTYLAGDSQLVTGWTLDGARFELIDEIESHICFERRSQWTFRGIEAPHQGEYAAGDFAKWVEGVAAREEDFAGLLESIASCNGDVVEVAHQIDIHEQTEAEEDDVWLVEGLLKANGITLLAGDQKAGKSSILMQLVGEIINNSETWLGFALNREIDSSGLILYLCGEDSVSHVKNEISLTMGGKPIPRRVNILPALQKSEEHDYRNLRGTLAGFKHSNITLVIVDPTRVYYKGDEDDSGNASEVFNVVAEFIQEKRCPGIMTQHLKKDSSPRCLDDIARMVRGSGVFLQRPRMVWGLLRLTGKPSQFGIARLKGIPQCNNARDAFLGVRLLSFDEPTGRHDPILEPEETTDEKPVGAVGTAATAATDEVKAAVLAVVTRFTDKAERITRTGKWGVYELKEKAPEIAGLPRTKVWSAIDSLLADGRLAVGNDGALTVQAAED
jgi:AAA domain